MRLETRLGFGWMVGLCLLLGCGDDGSGGGADTGTRGDGSSTDAESESAAETSGAPSGGTTLDADGSTGLATTAEPPPLDGESSTSTGQEPDPDPDPDPDPTGAEPPPTSVIQGCNTGVGYEVTTYRAEGPIDTPVFAVGVHDAPNLSPLPFEVTWALPGDGILVLTTYNETTWNVTIAPGASLSTIMVLGFEDQTVNVAGADPEVDVVEMFRDPAHEYPSLRGASVLAYVEGATGERVDGFDGCYEATGAYIGDSSIGGGPTPPPIVEPEGCAAIRDEAAFCLASGHSYRYALIGAESGSVCVVGDDEDWSVTIDESAASVDGTNLLVCDALSPNNSTGEATLAEIDVQTGQMAWTEASCESVVTIGDDLGVLAPDEDVLRVYEDVADVAAGVPTYEISGIAHPTLTELDGVLYSGASTLARHEIASGMPLAPVTIDPAAFPGLLASALDSLVVYDNGLDALRRHDPVTGALLETVPVDEPDLFSLSAIVCFDNPG